MLVRNFIGKEYEVDKCLGCEIVSENIEPFGGILYKNNYFIVTQDFELPIDGFIVISSVKHYENLSELTNEERQNLIILINTIIELLKQYNTTCEYNVVLEEKAGYHFHVWLMPRHTWMVEKFGKVLKNIKSIQDYAISDMCNEENIKRIENTCKKLKKDLNNIKL